MWVRQGSGVQTRWRAQALQRARRAATGLYPSLSTAFSVSFCSISDCTAGHHKHGEISWFRLEPACCAACLAVELHALFGSLLFPLLFSVDILLNRSQQLFASCTAKFADGQQCSIPVFDITHQTPLCEEHAKKMVKIEIALHSTQTLYLLLKKLQSTGTFMGKLCLDNVLQFFYKFVLMCRLIDRRG